MTDFNFAAVTVTKAAPESAPKLTRNRQGNRADNPLTATFQNAAKTPDQWFTMVLPGKVETVKYKGRDGSDKERQGYGETVTKAMNLLRYAASDANLGVAFRHRANDDGTVTLYFSATKKRETKKN